MPVSIAGRACRLRQWFGSDTEALVPLANDPYIARYLSHVFPQPYTRADAERWIRGTERRTSCRDSSRSRSRASWPAASASSSAPGERVGTASLGYWLGRRFGAAG